MTRKNARIEMIERNFSAFQAIRERLVAEHPGEFVVMRDERPAFFEATALEANDEARRRFPDGRYSIQHCVAGPLPLYQGWI